MEASLRSTSKRKLASIKERRIFLKLSRKRRIHMPGFVLQGMERSFGEDDDRIRVGYVCSKKLGNAVARNRAKRRLRAVANEVLPLRGRSGWDYLIVGRPITTSQREFRRMCFELESALRRLHG